MPLTGSWARRNQVAPGVPIQAATDEQHMTPDANPQFVNMAPTWQAQVGMPTLPNELVVEAGYPSGIVAPGGPVDQTPEDHTFGPGAQPGITQDQASVMRGYYGQLDMGAVEARAWQSGPDLDNQYHLAEIEDTVYGGDSPATLQYQQQGVGSPLDPDARLGKRQKRWSQRFIDYHRWDVHPSPYEPQYAVPQAATPGLDENQFTPQYGNRVNEWLGPVDHFVHQQVRRQPERYSDAYAEDGTTQNVAGSIADYGLGTWGL